MTNNVAWKSVLAAWEETYLTPESLWPHPGDAELKLDDIEDAATRRQIVEHMARCALCANRYRELVADRAKSNVADWAVVQRKAAAAETKEYPILYYSEKGEYKIEILQSSDGGKNGLVILTLLSAGLAAAHEGCKFMISDASGSVILQSKMVNGQAMQKVADLEQINDQSFLIRPVK